MTNNKTKEFNLSEKIWSTQEIKVKLGDDFISVKNVKEFIRLLKKGIPKTYGIPSGDEMRILNIIDKLEGDKLKNETK